MRLPSGTVLRAATWVPAGVCGTLLAAVLLAHVAGYSARTVVSGSMEPNIRVGDMVLNRSVGPLQAKPGDVISFRDPANMHRIITHRVQRVRVEGLRAKFVTKGDANEASERWQVPIDGTIGQVELRIPKVGYALNFVRSPVGRIGFLALPALLLAASLLIAIWRPEAEPQQA